jgi:hypothetical protein
VSDRILIAISVGILGMLMVFGSGVVAAGLACGFLTAVGFLLLALKSKRVRRFARRHPMLTDIIGSVGGYFMFPPGVTAFIGAGVVALMVTALISLDRVLNPEDCAPEPRATQLKARFKAESLLGRINGVPRG